MEWHRGCGQAAKVMATSLITNLPRMPRFFWLLLLLGVVIRSATLTQPLLDAHLLRQCQSAEGTLSLMHTPGLGLSFAIPWAGDFQERYAQEFPLYNYLVIAAQTLVGNLSMSGRLTSVALWATSFLLLQFIWRRVLSPDAAAWANLLFVTAPLSVWAGQAFMPEMLIQLLAFAFVLLVIRDDEKPGVARFAAWAAVGLVALLIKLPEISHLYLLPTLLIFWREGWRGWLRPRYFVGGAITVGCLLLWARHLDATNVSPLTFGDSSQAVRGFIGPLAHRLEWRRWLLVACYLGAFICPGPAALAVVAGLRPVFREQPHRLLAAWLISIPIFMLVWFENGPAAQSYYSLPVLAPLCALFGLGMKELSQWQPARNHPRVAITLATFVTLAGAVPFWLYLLKIDRTVLAAANWTRTHTESAAVILFRPNHRADMQGYVPNVTLGYHAERRTFVWFPDLPEPYRSAAFERSQYAVITQPQPFPGGMLGRIQRMRGMVPPQPQADDWLTARGFTRIAEDPAFIAYRRQ